MGVGLAHGQIAVDGIDLTTLVAGDDAGRHARSAQGDGEGAGEMFAKAGLAVKEELVGTVAPEQGR